jgi:dienelactone hydrolase
MRKNLLVIALLMCIFNGQLMSQNYQVGHTTITFNDPGRTGGFGSGGGPGRQIQTEIYYPADAAGTDVALADGEFPVVVFGHGFAMTWSAYENLWEEFVPNGYILALPRTEGGLFPAPSHEDFGLDLALVANRMLELNTTSGSIFFERVSPNAAIAGHSMGGGATMIAASGNNNIKTIVGLAPAETNPSAVAAASGISVPALVLSADGDAVTTAAEHHTPIYNALSSSCKYFVNIKGGAHCYYANTNFNCDFGELTSGGNITIDREEQHQITYDYLNLWFDYHLKGVVDAYYDFESLIASDNRTDVIIGCDLTSVPEMTPVSDIKLFPNPASDMITIQSDNARMDRIELFSIDGKLVMSKQMNAEYQHVISVEELNRGVYFVKSYGKKNEVLGVSKIILN